MKKELTSRQLQWIIQVMGFLFYAFLFFLAWYFYKERMIAYDSANYSLRMEQTGTFFLPHARWGSVFTQAIPLLALKSGCSLAFFLKSYSVSFILLDYLLFLACTLIFKNNKAGIAMLLSMSLGFRWMFYYTISELLTGMAFAILLYAVVASIRPADSAKRKTGLVLLSLFLIYTISYFHQLALFPALFVLLFELIAAKRYKDRTVILLFVLTVAWSYIRIKVFSVDEYTHGKILSFETYRTQLFRVFELPSWGYLESYLFSFAKWLFALLVFCSICLAWRKHWRLLVFFLSFSAGYALLVVLTYYKGESGLMIETYLPPLGLYTALVFVFLLFRKETEKTMLVISAFLLLMCGHSIYYASHIQLERSNYFERLIAYGRKLPNKKYLLDEKNIPVALVKVPWALPFETLLYSALDSKDSAVTFSFTHPIDRYDSLLERKGMIIGPSWLATWPYRNDAHMSLPDKGYLKVNSPQADSAFHPERYDSSNVQVLPVAAEVEVPYHGAAYAFVKIVNRTGHKIHSIPDSKEPVYLSYRIYDTNGQLLQHEQVKTPLDVDVYTDYTQAVEIHSPPDKGEYLLEIDFVSGDGHWWHCGKRMKLHIPGKNIFEGLWH